MPSKISAEPALETAVSETADAPDSEQGAVLSCRNCDAELAGSYCHLCGQKEIGPRLELRQMAGDALTHLLQWEGAFLHTVTGLTRSPATVCREYLEGKRARYVNPFKFCLTVTALFFLWTTLSGVDPGFEVAQHLSSEKQAAFAEEARGFVVRHMTNILFMALPIFGFLLRLLFRRSGRNFAECYVFALFVTGQAFLFSLTITILGSWFDPALVMATRALVHFFYLGWAAMVFFEERSVLGAIKVVFAQAAYMISVFFVCILFLLPRIVEEVERIRSAAG